VSDEEEDEIPEVMVDVLGHPILPPCEALCLKSRQHVVREVFAKAYSKFKLLCLTILF
jgi:hypothetical protein